MDSVLVSTSVFPWSVRMQWCAQQRATPPAKVATPTRSNKKSSSLRTCCAKIKCPRKAGPSAKDVFLHFFEHLWTIWGDKLKVKKISKKFPFFSIFYYNSKFWSTKKTLRAVLLGEFVSELHLFWFATSFFGELSELLSLIWIRQFSALQWTPTFGELF